MANVYLAAVQGSLGFSKLVVIKKARPELTQDSEFVGMFLDEARLAARLNHPNVVQTLEVGQDGDTYFLAMEYLDGQTLSRLRARAWADFTLPLQVRVLADALAGLHHAHEARDFDGTPLEVVHRDATPQNIFVTFNGVIKVVDFGIAKAIDSSSQTRAGVIKGKVTYMSPEQVLGIRVDRRTDIFAVGVMLWESIARRRLWKGMPEMGILEALTQGRIPSIREEVPDAPEVLARACERALAERPEDRYATALEMQEELLGFLEGTEGKGASARAVGMFAGEVFADERARARATIADHLHDVRWSGSHPAMSSSTLPKIEHVPPRSTPPAADVSRVTSSMTDTTASVAPSRKRGPRLFAPLALAAMMAALVAVGGARLLMPRGSPPSATEGVPEHASAADAPSSLPGAPLAEQGSVKLTVRVTPASAKVYLDGALLSAGAFEGQVARSERVRIIRIEAPHHVSRQETIRLTAETVLSFVLEKRPEGPTHVVGAPASGVKTETPVEPRKSVDTAAPVRTAPAPAPRVRTIDRDSPY
jgi:serine/threonine-protein kinase